MSSKESLVALGFEITHSTACPVVSWGKWFVGAKKADGRSVAGYGADEEAAFLDALTTVNKTV